MNGLCGRGEDVDEDVAPAGLTSTMEGDDAADVGVLIGERSLVV